MNVLILSILADRKSGSRKNEISARFPNNSSNPYVKIEFFC